MCSGKENTKQHKRRCNERAVARYLLFSGRETERPFNKVVEKSADNKRYNNRGDAPRDARRMRELSDVQRAHALNAGAKIDPVTEF